MASVLTRSRKEALVRYLIRRTYREIHTLGRPREVTLARLLYVAQNSEHTECLAWVTCLIHRYYPNYPNGNSQHH